MISREEAEELLHRWAGAELLEIRKHWFPPECSFLHEHIDRARRGGYRDNRVAATVDEVALHCTGRAMASLRERFARDHTVLRRHFIDGRPLGLREKQIALDRFALVYTPVAGAEFVLRG